MIKFIIFGILSVGLLMIIVMMLAWGLLFIDKNYNVTLALMYLVVILGSIVGIFCYYLEKNV